MKRAAALRCQLSFGALVIFGLINLDSSASPTQHPKRNINLYTIDLSPLFKWWSRHEGPRPLSSWVHITGSIVGTNAGAWIVEAKVDGAKPETDNNASSSARDPVKILLLNPPAEDLVEFEQLTSRLNELTIHRASLAGEESQARMHEQAVAGQQRVIRRNSAELRLLAAEEKQLKQVESTDQTEQRNLDEQIKEIKAKLAVYSKIDHYEVDCFALELRYDYGRLAVYDHGRVLK